MINPVLIERALEAIRKRSVNYEYFFDRLDSPDWIAPLLDAGFFRNPLPPVRKGDYVSFPFWPESRYLARMAKFPEAHERVLTIALEIPRTENVRVHEDLADLALQLPPKLATRLVPQALQWLESPYHLLLPEKLGKLIGHFVQGNEPDAALILARALFAIVPESEGSRRSREETALLGHSEPRVRFHPWLYSELLKAHLEDLLRAGALKAISLLCDLLESALDVAQPGASESEIVDYSYIWRPAIEEHYQNQDHGIKDALVSVIRDGSQRAALETPTSLPELLTIIENRRQPIFRRIVLHLLGSIPAPDPQAVAARLTDRELFRERAYHHEYYLLLEKDFGLLTPEQKDTILGWIEEGPIKANRVQKSGQEPSTEDMERSKRVWQLHRLMPLRESLSPEWRRRFEALVADLGTPENPEFLFYTRSWTGPTSPKSPEELGAMSIDDLVSYLTTWEPRAGVFEESYEGLGRTLTSLIASDPQRFEKVTRKFEGLDPTYVRSVLCGFHDALKQKRPFAWDTVVDLARWAVGQPVEAPNLDLRYRDRDPDWGWTRREVASLLSDGFEQRPNEIAFDLRTQAWTVLKPLTDDPDPTPEGEARYCVSGTDAANLAINSIRGEAMHAVMKYALWVRRSQEKEPAREEDLRHGMDKMPEVREVLEAHLDSSREPARAIRSVYGQWFPALVYIDRFWAAAVSERIFPEAPNERPLRDAAWEAYLGFRDPSQTVFEMLKAEYLRAVEDLEAPSTEIREPQGRHTRLAEHLMTLYWWGFLDLHEGGGLLERFYRAASGKLRGHAMDFVGRSLRNAVGDVPAAITDRLRILWQGRLAEAQATTTVQEYSEELAAFGWWFVSLKFDEEWALVQLGAILEKIGKVDPAHLVAEQLADVATRRPIQAVRCLRMMVDGDKEGWAVRGYVGHAKEILARALASDIPEARRAATSVVHMLGAKGHLVFRDLLRSKGK